MLDLPPVVERSKTSQTPMVNNPDVENIDAPDVAISEEELEIHSSTDVADTTPNSVVLLENIISDGLVEQDAITESVKSPDVTASESVSPSISEDDVSESAPKIQLAAPESRVFIDPAYTDGPDSAIEEPPSVPENPHRARCVSV